MTVAKEVIVIEGPDGAGKTSFAEHLLHTYKVAGKSAVLVHLTYDISLRQQWAEAKSSCLYGDWDLVILDRSPESEKCYGPVLRGTVRGSETEWAEWDRFVREVNAEKLLLMDDPKDLVARAFSRGESYLTRAQLIRVIDLYEQTLAQDTTWTELWGIHGWQDWLIKRQKEVWHGKAA